MPESGQRGNALPESRAHDDLAAVSYRYRVTAAGRKPPDTVLELVPALVRPNDFRPPGGLVIAPLMVPAAAGYALD
jgi:hypothetical protein